MTDEALSDEDLKFLSGKQVVRNIFGDVGDPNSRRIMLIALRMLKCPVSGEQIRSIIKKNNILKGSTKMPSSDKLKRLGEEISLHQYMVSLRKGIVEGDDEFSIRAQAAIETLLETTPRLLKRQRRFASFINKMGLEQIDGCNSIIERGRKAEHFCKLLNEVGKLRIFAPVAESVPEIDGWHDYAAGLGNSFREAVHEANPGARRLGHAANGPVVHFLAAVIPMISGETPTSGAIAQFMKRATRGTSCAPDVPGNI